MSQPFWATRSTGAFRLYFLGDRERRQHAEAREPWPEIGQGSLSVPRAAPELGEEEIARLRALLRPSQAMLAQLRRSLAALD